jgi:hypothetical protein
VYLFSSGAMELIFFSRADRTLTDRVTTAWGRAATGEGHTGLSQQLQH